MALYDAFADVYDKFMPDAPDDDWRVWLSSRYRLASLTMADIGCGTGRLTTAIAREGAAIIGIDNAESMLSRAAEHAMLQRVQVTWLCQDMRSFRLSSPVDVVISTCDALNYVLSEGDLAAVFARVGQSLKPGGTFCFDMLGPSRLRSLRGGIWYDFEETEAVVFETDVDENESITFDVHVFTSADGNTYRRFEEHHVQQFYSVSRVERLLAENGFSVETCEGDFGRTTLEAADRVVLQARRVFA